MVRRPLLAFAVLTTALLATANPAFASDGFKLFGDAMFVHPGNNSNTAVQIRSVGSGFGGIDFTDNDVKTFGQINNLGADFNFTTGTCGQGSPRFSIEVDTPSGPKNAFVYIGPPPSYTGCPQNVWQSTGNLAMPLSFVDTTQLGGLFYDPFADAQARFGSDKVKGIAIVVDAGASVTGTQTVRVDNVVINNQTFTFEGE